MFDAFVVSVVADGANTTPFVFVIVSAPVDGVSVPSPFTENPLSEPELLNWICPVDPAAASGFTCVQIQGEPDVARYKLPPGAASVLKKTSPMAQVPGSVVPVCAGRVCGITEKSGVLAWWARSTAVWAKQLPAN